MIIKHDIHNHTIVSSCSSDPEATVEAYIKKSLELGSTVLGISNHIWELKAATRSPLQKSEETREKRRKNEHLPFDLPPQKWFDHNFDQFCENYNFISFFTFEV